MATKKSKSPHARPKLTLEQRAAAMQRVAEMLRVLCSAEEIKEEIGVEFAISGRHVERFIRKVRQAWADAEAAAGVEEKRFRKHQMRGFFSQIASEAYTGAAATEHKPARPPDPRTAIRAAREIVRMDGNYTDVVELYDKTKAPPIDEAKREIAKRVAALLAEKAKKG